MLICAIMASLTVFLARIKYGPLTPGSEKCPRVLQETQHRGIRNGLAEAWQGELLEQGQVQAALSLGRLLCCCTQILQCWLNSV